MSDRLAHILFIPSWYPNSKNDLEGIFNQDFAMMMSNHLKISVIAIVSVKGISRHKFYANQPNENLIEWVIEIPEREGFTKIFNYINRVRLFWKFKKRIQKKIGTIDLVHASVAWPAGYYASLCKRYNKIPMVITEHYTGYFKEDGSLTGRRSIWSYSMLRLADAVTTVSGKLWDIFKKERINTQIKLIWNSIDKVFYELPIREYSNKVKYRFVHASNFDDRQKNTSQIIKTFIELKEEISDIELWLIVPEAPFEKFKKENANLNFAGVVHKTPVIEKQTYAEMIAACDGVISFSNYETFAMTVAESACAGLDCIATRSGGPEYYLQDGWGKIIAPGNQIELLETMRYYAQNGFSFIRRKAIATQARAFFNSEEIAKSYIELFKKIIYS